MVIKKKYFLLIIITIFFIGLFSGRGLTVAVKQGSAVLAIKNLSGTDIREIQISVCNYSSIHTNIKKNHLVLYPHRIGCGEDHYKINVLYSDDTKSSYTEGYISSGMKEYVLFLELYKDKITVVDRMTRVN